MANISSRMLGCKFGSHGSHLSSTLPWRLTEQVLDAKKISDFPVVWCKAQAATTSCPLSYEKSVWSVNIP